MTDRTIEIADAIVIPALKILGRCSPASVELVLGTGIHESGGWIYKRQLHNGPAKGYWQIEPRTFNDLWNRVVPRYNREYKVLLNLLNGDKPTAENLVYNDMFAAAMCRMYYLPIRAPLPNAGDLKGQAHYWKLYYNTMLGQGTEEQYIESWCEHVNYNRLIDVMNKAKI